MILPWCKTFGQLPIGGFGIIYGLGRVIGPVLKKLEKIMADNTASQSSIDALRAELESMREQIKSLAQPIGNKVHETAEELGSKLSKDIEHYRHLAAARAAQLRDLGQTGLEDVGEQVRRNPVASLLVAFGVGCLVTSIFRSLR